MHMSFDGDRSCLRLKIGLDLQTRRGQVGDTGVHRRDLDSGTPAPASE